MVLLCLLLAGNGCSGHLSPENTGRLVSDTGDIAVLIEFAAPVSRDTMPEAAANLSNTSCGRLHQADQTHSSIMTIAEQVDSSGKLMMLIIPEAVQFSGERDHLVIWTDSTGVPVLVSPELDQALLSDSLWDDPLERQRTILYLVNFFKPDVVIEFVPESESSFEVTEFWSSNAVLNNMTVALFVPPSEDESYRGWGAFTGKGILTGILQGMDIQGFFATMQIISKLNWNSGDRGYPAMQAFQVRETE